MSFLNLFRGTGNKLSKLASNKPTITKVDDAFARWASHHRDHQKKAIEALQTATENCMTRTTQSIKNVWMWSNVVMEHLLIS